MNYYLQHENSFQVQDGDGWFDGDVPVSYDAGTLPRAGETIEFRGFSFTVVTVFHEVDEAGRSAYPTVRVK